jgi:hypothetical protein
MRRMASFLVAGAIVAAALPAAAWGAATIVRERFHAPFEFLNSNPCNGEEIQFTGFINGQMTFVQTDETGVAGSFHTEVSSTVHAEGEGNLGNLYRTQQQFNFVSENGNADDPFAATFTQVLTIRVVAQGQTPNFSLRQLFHTTFNANGEATVTVENISSECNGPG